MDEGRQWNNAMREQINGRKQNKIFTGRTAYYILGLMRRVGQSKSNTWLYKITLIIIDMRYAYLKKKGIA